MWQAHPAFLEFYQNECLKAVLFRLHVDFFFISGSTRITADVASDGQWSITRRGAELRVREI